MRAVLVMVLGLTLAAAGEETKLGSGVTLGTATPIAALAKSPDEFTGKTIRIDGVATAVCTHMGCWMAVAAADNLDGPTVRLKVEDGAIVFPVSAKGRPVSAQGVLEAVGSDAHATEAAREHAALEAHASKAYHIKATGAVVR